MSETDTPRTCQTCRHKWRKGTVHYDSVECYNCETVNGNPGWQKDTDTLERELAAMTAERDALVQTSGTLCPHCGWRGLRGDPEQCAFCQNAKLSADLYNMTAAKELAERQVAVLADTLAHPVQRYPFGAMAWTTDQWAAWSRAEAMEGGKG